MAWDGSTRNRTWVPRATRAAAMARDEWLCQIRFDGCTTDAEVVDHITPVSQGGTNELDNLRAACTWCNEEYNRRTKPTPRRPSNRRPREHHPGLA
jgi:5-methylcytosine-specific restriction protein A